MGELLETTYEHLKGGSTFTITAAEQWSIGMVRRLKEKYPEQVEIACINKDGSILARMPFDWMRIVPKRQDTRSPEKRMVATERMNAARAKKQTAVQKENDSNSHASPGGISQPSDGEKEA